jgi:Ca2+-binding EF-hand superfamily protein
MSRARLWAAATVFISVSVLVFTAPGFARSPEDDSGSVPGRLRDRAQVDQEWEKAADTNQDGVVDRTEMRNWRRAHRPDSSGESTQATEVSETSAAVNSTVDRSQVNRPWEKAADNNNDGRVDRAELKQWNREGNNPPGPRGGPGAGAANVTQASQVNRPWEKAADSNQDGTVEKAEVKKWNREGNNAPGPRGGPGASPRHRP